MNYCTFEIIFMAFEPILDTFSVLGQCLFPFDNLQFRYNLGTTAKRQGFTELVC